MTKTKKSKEQQPMIVNASDPDRLKGEKKALGGSQSDDWNDTLFGQAGRTLWGDALVKPGRPSGFSG